MLNIQQGDSKETKDTLLNNSHSHSISMSSSSVVDLATSSSSSSSSSSSFSSDSSVKLSAKPSDYRFSWELRVRTEFAFYASIYEEFYDALRTARHILDTEEQADANAIWRDVYLTMERMIFYLDTNDSHLTQSQIYGGFWKDKEMRIIEDGYTQLAKKDTTNIHKIKYLRNNGRWLSIERLCEILSLPSCFIENLSLSGNQIGDLALEILAKILPTANLRILNLSYNSISDYGITKLAEVLPQLALNVLNLKANSICNLGLKNLALNLPKTKIAKLYLGENSFNANDLNVLIKILPQTCITHLDLGSSYLDEKAAQMLGEILPETAITYLDINSNNIGDRGIYFLAKALPKTQIKFLNLVGNNIGDLGIQELARYLPQTPQLLSLNLKRNTFGELGGKKLAMILPQTYLAYLNLYGNDISRSTAMMLAQALPLTPIAHLNLELCKMGEVELQEIICRLPDSLIQHLNLSNTTPTPATMGKLIEVLPRTRINTLKLAMNKIGPTEALKLARVLPQTQVVNLDIKQNWIAGLGLIQFLSALTMAHITNLDISGNNKDQLDYQSLMRLMQIFTQTQIQTLNFSYSNLGSLGIAYLAKFLPRTSITHLDIKENHIDDLGLRELIRVLPQTQLVNLEINGYISKAELQDLTKVFPSTRVNIGGVMLNILSDSEAKKLAAELSQQAAVDRYGFYLISIDSQAQLPDFSQRHAKLIPVLVKRDKEIYVYGAQKDGTFKYTKLDANKFDNISFPTPNAPEVKWKQEEIPKAIYQEIVSKGGHYPANLALNESKEQKSSIEARENVQEELKLAVESILTDWMTMSNSTSTIAASATAISSSKVQYDIMLVTLPENAIEMKAVADISEQCDFVTADNKQTEVNQKNQSEAVSETMLVTEPLEQDRVMFSAEHQLPTLIPNSSQDFSSSQSKKKKPVLIKSGNDIFLYGISAQGLWKITKLDSSISQHVHFPELSQAPMRLAGLDVPKEVIQEIAAKEAHIPPVSDNETSINFNMEQTGGSLESSNVSARVTFSLSGELDCSTLSTLSQPPIRKEGKPRHKRACSLPSIDFKPTQLQESSTATQNQVSSDTSKNNSVTVSDTSNTQSTFAQPTLKVHSLFPGPHQPTVERPTTASHVAHYQPTIGRPTTASHRAAPSLRKEIVNEQRFWQTIKQTGVQHSTLRRNITERRNSTPCLQTNIQPLGLQTSHDSLPNNSPNGSQHYFQQTLRRQESTLRSHSLSLGRGGFLPVIPEKKRGTTSISGSSEVMRPKSNSLPLNFGQSVASSEQSDVLYNKSSGNSYLLSQANLQMHSMASLSNIAVNTNIVTSKFKRPASASLHRSGSNPNRVRVITSTVGGSVPSSSTSVLSSNNFMAHSENIATSSISMATQLYNQDMFLSSTTTSSVMSSTTTTIPTTISNSTSQSESSYVFPLPRMTNSGDS